MIAALIASTFRVMMSHSFSPRTFARDAGAPNVGGALDEKTLRRALTMHLQKNMSYVRVEHFVPSRERAVRRVRLRSWSGLQTRSFTYHRTWDVSLLAFRARRDGFARARRVLRRLLFYAIFQFTLSSAFQA